MTVNIILAPLAHWKIYLSSTTVLCKMFYVWLLDTEKQIYYETQPKKPRGEEAEEGATPCIHAKSLA